MKILFGLLLTGTVFFASAQKKTDPVFFANGILTDSLKKHLFRLAGREFEGRETATYGQKKAAEYIEQYFKNLGLQPGNKDSFQLAFPVFKDSLISCGIHINGIPFEIYKEFDAPLSLDYDASFGSSEVVYVGYGLCDSVRDDYKGLDVAGKIVLMIDGYPPGYVQKLADRRKFNGFAKADAAQQHGAIAIFIIQKNFPRHASVQTGAMYRKFYRPKIHPNIFYVSEKIAAALIGTDYESAKSANLPSHLYYADVWVSIRKQTFMLESTEVLGFLQGSDLKDEILIISAHYDHLGKKDSLIFYGADDNASGTVALMQLAAAFVNAKANGAGPRRSILFLANSGEEKGLWGSEYYSDHPTYPLDKTTANLNTDMIGRKDPKRKSGDSNNYVYIVGDDKLSSDLHSISVAMNKKYTGLELDYKFNDPKDPLRIYYRSDHYNFAKKGVPIIFYFDGINDDYHKPTDTPDKIDYELMLKRTRLVFYTAWEIANRKKMLLRDLPSVAEER